MTIAEDEFMGWKRRAFIGGSSVLITGQLAGCSESEADSDEPSIGSSGGSADGSSGGRTPSTPEPETMIDRTVRVSEDDYRPWTFSVNYDVRLDCEFTVRSGPEIEFLVMDSGEYQQYRNENRFHAQHFSGLSGRESIFVSPDEDMAFVIDNTEAGWVEPPTNFDDDVAEVEVEVTLHYAE